MNNRERILAILDHRAPDRIPWIPRLDLWYNAKVRTNSLPPAFAGYTLREVEQALRLGAPARDGFIYRIEYDGVEVVTQEQGGQSITEYHTPLGSLRQVMVASKELAEQGIQGLMKEHVLKTASDYRVLEWVVEHMRFVPAYEEYRAYDQSIGDDGLPMVEIKFSPFWDFLEVFGGFEAAYYHMSDYPHEVEHLLRRMEEVYRERLWPVVVESPAQMILTDAHLSSQLTPPRLFDQYLLPYHRDFCALLRSHGKCPILHADADTSKILRHIELGGWEMVECFVTAPMVEMTLEKARQAWGNRMIIWGGVPSVLLSASTPEEEFRAAVRATFRAVAPGDAFLLGIADNAMPESLIERVAWISDYVEEHGAYPLG
jgi:uroporphyrinogen-III decarboxylase